MDCVRSLAIVFVVACHGSLMVFPWFGWHAPIEAIYAGTYGVTLFFTLSGFLIGRILLRLAEQSAGWRDWLAFMRRRWARTLPLYFLWLLLLAKVWPPHALDPDAADHLWRALPWFLSLTQNLAWRPVEDWFGVSWSLCVEEWFYLVFSAALLLGARVIGCARAFWLVLGVFLLVPPILRACLPAWNSDIHSDTGIVLLRLDSVGYGVLLAWCWQHAPRVARHRYAIGGCGLALLMVFLSGALDPLIRALGHWGDAATLLVLPLGCALCLPAAAGAVQAPTWLRRPIEAISDQSYGIYLCHLSILEWVNYDLRLLEGLSPTFCILVVVGAIWSFSLFSFRFIEVPILTRGPRPRLLPEGKLAG